MNYNDNYNNCGWIEELLAKLDRKAAETAWSRKGR